MMLQKLPVVLALLLISVISALAQPNAKLKFIKELPKDLFKARTAAIITVVTTDTDTDPQEKYAEITRKLKADNVKMGFNLVHYSNGENLNTLTGMQQQANVLNQLSVEKLFLIDYVNIAGTGSQENYKLVITPFNKNSTFTTENQKAFSLQADSYERLMAIFLENIDSYPGGFFDKSGKTNATNTDIALKEPEPEPVGDHRTPQTLPNLPQVYLAAEDLNRGAGGTQRNFYYSVQGQNLDINAGFFGQRLRQDIQKSATAINYLNKYRADKRAYLAGWTVITGSIVGYASQVYQDVGTSYFNDKQKVFAAAAVLATISNILVTKNTNLHFKKAVDEYNIFTLTKGSTGNTSLKPTGFLVGALVVPNTQKVAPALQLSWKISP